MSSNAPVTWAKSAGSILTNMAVPKLIVLSAPSGSGKTTIAREILKRHPDFIFSISATTRPQRSTEVDGRDYFFLTKEEFDKRVLKSELVEWEEIYGYSYGSLRSEIERALHAETSMLFDIDVKGALSIKRQFPDETVLIFVQPPSMEVLNERLLKRRTEDTETIRRRLDRVPMEMGTAHQFDAIVVNDDLRRAADEVDAIINRSIQSATS